MSVIVWCVCVCVCVWLGGGGDYVWGGVSSVQLMKSKAKEQEIQRDLKEKEDDRKCGVNRYTRYGELR